MKVKGTRPQWIGTLTLVFAVVLMVAVPLVPGVLAEGSALGLVRIPVESLIAVLVLWLLPSPWTRRVVAAAYGAFIVVALAFAGLDAAFEYALDIHFDPTDWPQVGDGYGVVQDSVGQPAAIVIVIVIGFVALAAGFGLAWAALRVDAAIRRNRRRGRIATTAVTAAWVVALLAGSQLVAGQSAAASASIEALTSASSRASQSVAAQGKLPAEVSSDAYAKLPASSLLTSLKGKDVVLAFVESYGQVAVQGTDFSGGVDKVLASGQSGLTADGYTSQSAWLNSPTFGGLSWLAHSTLETGLWVNKAPIYSDVIRSKRFTLSDAFASAGWKTVSDVPSDTQPWPFGRSFYHFDKLYTALNVGYVGPRFGYARVPDQYTWQYFYDHELAKPHQPVFSEIDLVSSHTPWAPLPQMVAPSSLGNGSIYDPQPAESEPSDTVWQDRADVQKFYGKSVQYSLSAMFQFLHASKDPNLVVIMLGDHQPATIVSGEGANHQVPITIIAKDPKVFQAISNWKWVNGDKPTAAAPLWQMDAFRNRFLTAFDQ
jgi:hypothetical protein